MGDRKVSRLEWVVMEEKLSETGNPLIDVETNIDNYNNVHILGGYSRLMGHFQQNYNHSVIWICMYFY